MRRAAASGRSGASSASTRGLSATRQRGLLTHVRGSGRDRDPRTRGCSRRAQEARAPPPRPPTRRKSAFPGDDEPRDPHADERGDRHERPCCSTRKLDAEQHDYAATIRDSGDALLTIINDILDFSKIEAGRMDIEAQRRSICASASSRRSTSSARAPPRSSLDIAYVFDGDVPAAVNGDVTRLRQILLNLLVQRRQVHRGGRGRAQRQQRRLATGDSRAHVRRARHRHRTCRQAALAPVPVVLAGRLVDDAQVRRHAASGSRSASASPS